MDFLEKRYSLIESALRDFLPETAGLGAARRQPLYVDKSPWWFEISNLRFRTVGPDKATLHNVTGECSLLE